MDSTFVVGNYQEMLAAVAGAEVSRLHCIQRFDIDSDLGDGKLDSQTDFGICFLGLHHESNHVLWVGSGNLGVGFFCSHMACLAKSCTIPYGIQFQG